MTRVWSSCNFMWLFRRAFGLQRSLPISGEKSQNFPEGNFARSQPPFFFFFCIYKKINKWWSIQYIHASTHENECTGWRKCQRNIIEVSKIREEKKRGLCTLNEKNWNWNPGQTTGIMSTFAAHPRSPAACWFVNTVSPDGRRRARSLWERRPSPIRKKKRHKKVDCESSLLQPTIALLPRRRSAEENVSSIWIYRGTSVNFSLLLSCPSLCK